MQCYIKLFYFKDNYGNCSEVSHYLEFLRYVLLFNELDINDTSTVSLIVHLSVYRVLRKFEDIKVSVITSAVTPIQS